MKAGEAAKVGVLRLLVSALNNKKIEKQVKEGGEAELKDEEVLEVVGKEAKKRKEAIALFLEGGREDLASKEESELKILGVYLPTQMAEADVRKIVEKVVAAAPVKDFGQIMKEVMKELKGKADAGLITKILKEELGA